MLSEEDLQWGAEAILRASAVGVPDAALAALIEFLDSTGVTEPQSFRQQLMTRAIVAAGRVLLEQKPIETVAATVAAAEEYVLFPTESTFEAYFEAATNSYPYGAGEGHYAIGGRSDCAPGSGCRTGIGSLESIAAEVGARSVLAVIVEEIRPWLEGKRDPVAARRGSAHDPVGQFRG